MNKESITGITKFFEFETSFYVQFSVLLCISPTKHSVDNRSPYLVSLILDFKWYDSNSKLLI